jgi:FkbM family methyltransferase
VRRVVGRRPPQHLLRLAARRYPDAFFIDVGAALDRGDNPLIDVVLASRWQGVVVEPIPAMANRLRRLYTGSARVSVEQAAIGRMEGEQPFFYAPVAEGSAAEPATMLGSLQREVLFFPETYRSDLDDTVVEMVTPVHTFESLCREHGRDTVDVIRIDTAGDEATILEGIDLERLRPSVVNYDHSHLGAGVRQATQHRLLALGYEVLEYGRATWCFRPAAFSAREAAALRWGWRAWDGLAVAAGRARAARRGRRADGSPPVVPFPVSEDERRYLANGYDDRQPLPDRAAAYLTRENPRLAELRRQYASLDFPVLNHHLWNADRVAGNVDLRYFRGDNLYVWHYPDHPKAMALRFVLYMRYLESHGGRELLEALSEDGAFGCWTTEVTNYGKVSRDLLDSVNEISFLDRHLNVLTRRVRILDIGAGYGRLAHRMSVAAPELADYCCVDAIPESTFLAEYYLGFRDIAPARVLPLPEVPALEPGSFDVAINVHSFSECTIDAVRWWVDQIRRLEIPYLFIVPNEADGILSSELDGSYHSVLPVLRDAGYVPIAKERAIADRATRDALMLNDNFYLFSSGGRSSMS